VRIGYYKRWVVDFVSRKELLIYIARYLCRRKNPNFKDKKAHRTFSLLPSSIIPYKRYDAHTMLFIAEKRYSKNSSILAIVLELLEYFSSEAIGIDVSHIPRYLKLFRSACLKLSIYLNEIKYAEPLSSLCFLKKKDISGYCFDFFNKEGKFLFGTPSQHR
jgi:hypothetical protein